MYEIIAAQGNRTNQSYDSYMGRWGQFVRITMKFEDKKYRLIRRIEKTGELSKDSALKRVVQLIKTIETVEELYVKKELINRISLDSVQNWDTAELILNFTRTTSKS